MAIRTRIIRKLKFTRNHTYRSQEPNNYHPEVSQENTVTAPHDIPIQQVDNVTLDVVSQEIST